jgi:hypothetical protein
MKKQQKVSPVVYPGTQNFAKSLREKDNFNIEILVINISTELKESLLNAPTRQYR